MTRRRREGEQFDLAVEMAWMHHIEGLSQADISERRGLSRMKVHRLLQIAREEGIVHVYVDCVPKNCGALESRLIESFGLTSCVVAPDAQAEPDMFASMPAVASAAARFLLARLEPTDERVIGIGSGRTIAAAVAELPQIARPQTSFVSMTGDFAVLNDANPFEVINSLIMKTGGRGHALTAPLIVESREDRDLFLRQRGVRHAMQKLGEADFLFTGVGHVGRHSFFDSYQLLTTEEQIAIRESGAVADIAGNLVDEQGAFFEMGIAHKMLAAPPDLLRRKQLVVVVGGVEKATALRGALRSGCVNGLVTHEALARAVLA